ncbi:MAG: type IV pilus modification protein PilV [Gammaproteobacteria bacterium]|nr:type IV pilus modification protein PilV [Gammaproteobacteria bacterium]
MKYHVIPRSNRGVSLIEVLIAMVVVSLALVGHLTLQSRTISNQQAAVFQSTANSLAIDMVERLSANREGMTAGNYDIPTMTSGYASGSLDCTANACTPAQLAEFDLRTWWTRASVLPGAAFQITREAARPNELQFIIAWKADHKSGGTATTCDATDGNQCLILVRVI